MPTIAELALAASEPPVVKREPSKRDADVLRRNIELFVDGVMMEDKYKLVDLLNESFSMDMLELLFKRMTAKLRMMLFSREKTYELINIALNPSLPRHTRSLATSFIVVGSPASCAVACAKDDHKCLGFWTTIFSALKREADANAGQNTNSLVANGSSTPTNVIEPVEGVTANGESAPTVAELEELIQIEVKDIERHGAKSLQRSFSEKLQAKVNAKSSDEDDDDDDRRSTHEDNEPRTPTSARVSGTDETDKPPAAATITPVSDVALGLVGEDTANFASQVLRYFAVRGQKAACILQFLATNTVYMDLLMANIGHDDIRTLLLHVVYADHSDAAIEALFQTRLIDRLIEQLLMFGTPRNAYDRDRVENCFLLLREIVHAPYLTGRGVAISAKTIPLDKVTGMNEYVSICGASRETANSALRKYTSRKVRHVIHLFMLDDQVRIEQLFVQMIKELTFWSSPTAQRERRGSITSMESRHALSLVDAGHPRPVCTAMLTHLFELTETVDFSEEHTRKAGGANAAAATSVGIDCLNFMCSTHLVKTGDLLVKKKLRNEVQPCHVGVNCMMGLRVTVLRENSEVATITPTTSTLDAAFAHTKGNQSQIPLDEIDSVAASDWHAHGFVVVVKKKTVLTSDMGYASEVVARSEEYFAASSDAERDSWLMLLQQVIDGDLTALEIFCSDDWRSNVREYRRLRECLITSMERKGHELMVFLKQVLVLDQRKASGYHLWTLVKFLHAVLTNESKRLDQMFVSAQLLRVLLVCYTKYPHWNLLLGEITKMLVFVVGDFKNKRSRRCPIVAKLVAADGAVLQLLTKAFVGTDGGRQSEFAGTDTLSNLKLLVESIRLCYTDPKSRSQERIQAVLRETPEWQTLLKAVEAECAAHPSLRITSLPVAPSKTDPASHHLHQNQPAVPTQPTFQEDIINRITRPAYYSAHGFGSSFLLGDGCAFGYMFKERQGGAAWQKVLLVYEYVSHKLWFFYPSEVDETHHIQWKWIIPVAVRSRYTHGHDETHSSVGHHGLFVTAYDNHHDASSTSSFLLHSSSTPAATYELHFSVTKLEDRDQWKAMLSKAARDIHELATAYQARVAQLKKPDKKTTTHCQDRACNTPFKLFRRPHSCKRCGLWFCGKCSTQRLSIPEVGLMQPVRHCRACYEAAGGLAAEQEPTKLFHHPPSPAAKSKPSDHLSTTEMSNIELYELAHGMVSPRSMLQMRRRMTRQDSVDSPTSAGYRVDEVDGDKPRQFFAFDGEPVGEEEEPQLSPYGSPPPLPSGAPLLREERGEDLRG